MSLNNLIQDLVVGAMSQQGGGQQAGGGLGGILGSMLGGGQAAQPAGGALGGMLGSVLGGLTGGQQGQATGGGQAQLLMVVLPFLLNWVQQKGGLQQALASLTQSGLGDHVQSWVAAGENMPVQANQLAGAFPQEAVSQLAQNAGVSTNDVYGTIAHVLPQIINVVTPNGQVEGSGADDQIQNVLGALGGLLR